MIGQEWTSQYSTIKTPGIHHRAYYLTTLNELATIGGSPEFGPVSGLEPARAV
jgi:hypothetical protein